VKRLTLMRHANAQWKDPQISDFDRPLNRRGISEAEAMSRRLIELKLIPTLVLTSSARRARQTAEIIGRRLGLAVAMELDDLREINVGELDGRSDEEAWDTYTRVLAAWQAGETGISFPSGENCAELCARLRRALAAVARGAGDTRSLVVAHGANLRAALPGLAGEPDPGVDLPTGGLAALRVEPASHPFPLVQLLTWPG